MIYGTKRKKILYLIIINLLYIIYKLNILINN